MYWNICSVICRYEAACRHVAAAQAVLLEDLLENVRNKPLTKNRKNPRNRCGFKDFSGAAGQIRTADLVITNDALYRLSYSSKSLSQERSVIIAQSRDLSSGDFRFFIFPRKNGAAAKCSQFLFLSFTVRTRFPPILIIKDLPNPLFLLFFFSFFKTKARSRLAAGFCLLISCSRIQNRRC